MFLNLFWDDEIRERPTPARVRQIKTELFKIQKGKCMYCGHAPGKEYIDLDHKNPLSNGGSNNINNFQMLCGPCNRLKGNRTNTEFRRMYKFGPSTNARPPAKRIPRSRFESTTKSIKQKKAKTRRRDDGLDWWTSFRGG